MADHAALSPYRLALELINLHGLVLMIGQAYTYARVLSGFVVADWLHLARNPYDGLGHFTEGAVPQLSYANGL